MANNDRIAKSNFQASARLLLQPLDLESLIKKGMLVKKGAWYRVDKIKDLPAHVRTQVCEIAHNPNGNGSLIKFAKLSKSSRAKFEKVVGRLPKS